ncbi:MAG TPA: hypothetical protein VGS00_00045, partial [Thermoanaerobaculia bacterium]|nr:hypothetical protein [Thermoanaerobaculia bacterium]
MSLIDEALKRAQAVHEGETRPGCGARPWTPVPLPDRTEARRRTARRAAGVVALALAIVAAAWLLRPATKGLPLHQRESERAGRPPAVPALPTPLEEAIVAPPSRDVSAQPTRGPVAAARPAAPAEAGLAASSPAPAPASAPPGRLAPTLANGHTYVGSISLPGGAKIELGGIVYSESNATALVNGRIVGAGAYVEGFTVVKIEQARLELEG